jgi:aryl-alcohol dehydrogenase-like predicted oxidoreductase
MELKSEGVCLARSAVTSWLRLERIDLYQLHTVDPRVPMENSLGALKEMRDAGKIQHVGLSNVGPGQIERARKGCADRNGAEPIQRCEPEMGERAEVLRERGAWFYAVVAGWRRQDP